MKLMSVILWLFALLVGGCSGYSFKRAQNPLAAYGIKSLTIPMFLNKSPFPEASSLFTREVKNMFHQFGGLKVYSGERKGVDAILLGIVDAAASLKEAQTNVNLIFTGSTSNEISEALGERSDFYMPSSNQVALSVNFIMIKNPSMDLVELARGELGKLLKDNPKVVLNTTYHLTRTFNRPIYSNQSDGQFGREANYTRARGLRKAQIVTMAKEASQRMKDLVLYAF